MAEAAKGWVVNTGRLTSPLEIEGERWNGFFRSVGVSVALFIIGIIAIAAVAPINEVAMSQGEITPTQQPSALQHREGGIVSEILVTIGDRVSRGQPIMQLSAFQNESEQVQVGVRIADARLNIARLQALLDGAEPQFPDADLDQLGRQKLAYVQELLAYSETTAVLAARVAQKEADYIAANKQIRSLKEETNKQMALLEMRQSLAAEGYASRRSLIESEASMARVEGQLAQAEGRVLSADEAMQEAIASQGQQLAEYRAKWSMELVQITTELKDFEERLAQQKNRMKQLVIRAPFDGRVQDLLPKAPGEVVRAGEEIGLIVPLDSRLYASVRLMPKDVGSVSLGDQAVLTLTAFDPNVFGELLGDVTSISPTTSTDQQGNIFYDVKIMLIESTGDAGADLSRLIPGMQLQARIRTEQRTMLRYFLRPVYRSLERAFSES